MSEQHMDGTVAVDASCGKAGFLVLLRHGQTFWSESGQHTGRTNIPLTEVGRQQAMDAGARLREAFPEGFDPECVFSSPLKRACQTAELAGFAQHGILDGIVEWDYGRAEGRTRQQVSEASGFSWDVWRDGPRSLTPTLEGWRNTGRGRGAGQDCHRRSDAVAAVGAERAIGCACPYSAYPDLAMAERGSAIRASAAIGYCALLGAERV